MSRPGNYYSIQLTTMNTATIYYSTHESPWLFLFMPIHRYSSSCPPPGTCKLWSPQHGVSVLFKAAFTTHSPNMHCMMALGPYKPFGTSTSQPLVSSHGLEWTRAAFLFNKNIDIRYMEIQLNDDKKHKKTLETYSCGCRKHVLSSFL